ncbi:sperm acrosome developmental regulator [Ctenodactylus gundi]
MVWRFFKWVKRVWQKMAPWVFFWRHQGKKTILDHTGSKKRILTAKKTASTTKSEACELAEPPREAKLLGVDESPKVAEPCLLEGTQVTLNHKSRSLLRLPLTAVRSVSTVMLSALQYGWQICHWKSSVSAASVTSQMRAQSSLDSPEAEVLKKVYLVLWVIRKQLRQLACRQERHRRRHIRARWSPPAGPVLALKQDIRNPL